MTINIGVQEENDRFAPTAFDNWIGKTTNIEMPYGNTVEGTLVKAVVWPSGEVASLTYEFEEEEEDATDGR
jgi:hypothetical protein